MRNKDLKYGERGFAQKGGKEHGKPPFLSIDTGRG